MGFNRRLDISQPVSRDASQDGFTIGLTAVDDNPVGAAAAIKGSSQEPPGCRQIPKLAEEEFHRVAHAIDGAVEIRPLAAHLDIGFIHVPTATDSPFAPVEAFQQFRRVAQNSAVDRGVIDANVALGHHLFQIPQAQTAGEIPTCAQHDHGTV
jgi:hypothetical protein